MAVPDTIQEVLLARINRLPDEPKRLLQTAAILGREVSLRLLGAIWEGPGVLDPHFREFTRLEFLYEQTGAEEPVYVFTHALTQEVAYESLLIPRRQALHEAAGRALEALYADRLEEAIDRLAYHYSRTERADKAVEYLTRFAKKAAQGHAHTEAIRALRRGPRPRRAAAGTGARPPAPRSHPSSGLLPHSPGPIPGESRSSSCASRSAWITSKIQPWPDTIISCSVVFLYS